MLSFQRGRRLVNKETASGTIEKIFGLLKREFNQVLLFLPTTTGQMQKRGKKINSKTLLRENQDHYNRCIETQNDKRRSDQLTREAHRTETTAQTDENCWIPTSLRTATPFGGVQKGRKGVFTGLSRDQERQGAERWTVGSLKWKMG